MTCIRFKLLAHTLARAYLHTHTNKHTKISFTEEFYEFKGYMFSCSAWEAVKLECEKARAPDIRAEKT